MSWDKLEKATLGIIGEIQYAYAYELLLHSNYTPRDKGIEWCVEIIERCEEKSEDDVPHDVMRVTDRILLQITPFKAKRELRMCVFDKKILDDKVGDRVLIAFKNLARELVLVPQYMHPQLDQYVKNRMKRKQLGRRGH